MKFNKRLTSLTLVIAIIMQLFTGLIVAETSGSGTVFFNDLSNHWATESIKFLADRGLVKGYLTDNGYIIKPDAYITRAEYLAVLLNTKSELRTLDNKIKLFYDVKDSDWYKEVVDKASSNGILEGYPDGSFRPNNPITRAEITALVSKMNNWSENDIVLDVTEFSDVQKNSWYYVSVMTCKLKNIINGYPDGTFRPENYASRGEAFALLANYVKNVIDIELEPDEKPGVGHDLTSPSPSPSPSPNPTTNPSQSNSTTPSNPNPIERGPFKDKSVNDFLYIFSGDFKILNEEQENVTIDGLVDRENVKNMYYNVKYYGFDITTPEIEKNRITDGLAILGPNDEEKGLFNKNQAPYSWELKDFKLDKDYFKIDIILVIEDQYGNTLEKPLVNINDKDSDGDGLSDYEEVYIYDTDPLNADTDGDGLSDYDEIHIYGTDPLNPDTDGDGLSDYEETKVWVILELGVILPIFYNASEYEEYGMEGVRLVAEKYGYKEEQIIMGLDPLNPDTDGDGLPDGYEFRVLGTDPTRHITYGMDVADIDLDIDGDGLSNWEEFLSGTNPWSTDTDGDGLSDYEEIHTYNTDPTNPDTDGDGLIDGLELEHSFDPLHADSSNSGILDSEKFIRLDLSKETLSDVLTPENKALPSISVFGVADFDINTTVINASKYESIRNIVGLVGYPISIKTDRDFESAEISFKISQDVLKSTNINNLAIFYFDEVNDTIEFLETEINAETNTIKTTVDHFSIYGVLDIVRFAQSWGIKDILDKLAGTNEEPISPIAEVGQTDIVFVIDTTGSMGSVINNVKNNITNFANTLMDNNVDVRLGLIDYKDLHANGMNSTKNLGWFDNISDFISSVNNMRATGGGDEPESTVDALEEARRMDFRPGVNKFIMLFTDATYKEFTRFEDVQSMESVIKKLKEDKIVVSAIVPSHFESLYRNLYTETGGVYADITRAFSSELKLLINNITSVTHDDGIWIRLSNGMLKKLEGVSSKEELLELSSGGYYSFGDLFLKEITVNFFGLKVKTFREAFNKNAVDVRITPSEGYSGGEYTIDAVATIVTDQKVDKAIVLFRLLNGNWMQYNAHLDSKFIMSKHNVTLPEGYPSHLDNLFTGYRANLNILDSGLREFKVILLDKEGRTIVESEINKVNVNSSIRWADNVLPLETITGNKEFSVIQHANVLAGKDIALFLRKDGNQSPIMIDSSKQKYRKEQQNYKISFVSNDLDVINKTPKYANGVYWISVHVIDESGRSLIKSNERKIKINNIWISENYNSGQNNDIYKIKDRLNQLGYFGRNNLPLTINTVFDQNTSFAVAEFKRVNDLNDKGIFKGVVCSQTWNVLFSSFALKNDKLPVVEPSDWNFQTLGERLRFLSASELDKELSNAKKEGRPISSSAEMTRRLNLINSRIANDWIVDGRTRTRFAKRYLNQCANNGVTPPTAYNTEAKVIKALTWDDKKIENLYKNSIQFQSLDIDPRLLLAIIIQEGTGSFNTNPEVKDGNGGHYIQPDFDKDLKAALDNQFLRKANAYRYYGDDFSTYVSSLSIAQHNLTSGKGNLYQFLNYATVAAIVDLTTNEITELKPHGVYATHDGWWKNVETIFGSFVDNNGEKPSVKYSNLFKNSRKIPLKSGYSRPSIVFKTELIDEVIYNDRTGKYDRGYTIKAVLSSQSTPKPEPIENVFPLKYGDSNIEKGNYIKEVHDLLSNNIGKGLEYLKITSGDSGYGKNYGPKTSALVKLFQSQNGATVNGQIDENTLNKLRNGDWKLVAPSEGKYIIRGSFQNSYFELVVDTIPNISDTGDFSSKLKRLSEEYTNFAIDGVRVKLPYYQTKGTLYGGKKTPEDIRNFVRTKTQDPLKYQDIVNDTKNLHIVGIDCSGLVAYVLNEATEGLIHKTHGQTGYANGISAASLTSKSLGKQITAAKDIVPGAIMNTDTGGHVIIIYEVIKTNGKVTRINYAHSNGSKGPHKGYIDIGDENQDLDGSSQRWHDDAYTDQEAKKYYTYTILRNEVVTYLK